MIEVRIPGFGPVRLEHLVSDFTGTLSCDGRLIDGVAGRIREISRHLSVHVLTADTCGTARAELAGLPCRVEVLAGPCLDGQKERFVLGLEPEAVAAFGNGMNDRLMLRAARLGIAVSGPEGCAVEALIAADIHVCRITDAFDLLLRPKRCLATLRF